MKQYLAKRDAQHYGSLDHQLRDTSKLYNKDP